MDLFVTLNVANLKTLGRITTPLLNLITHN
jgi:hypothetical protein